MSMSPWYYSPTSSPPAPSCRQAATIHGERLVIRHAPLWYPRTHQLGTCTVMQAAQHASCRQNVNVLLYTTMLRSRGTGLQSAQQAPAPRADAALASNRQRQQQWKQGYEPAAQHYRCCAPLPPAAGMSQSRWVGGACSRDSAELLALHCALLVLVPLPIAPSTTSGLGAGARRRCCGRPCRAPPEAEHAHWLPRL